MRRLLLAAAVIALAPASVAAAEEEPKIVSIVDKCPVSEGGYQYSADFFVPHPTVEHARYDGELHYPSGHGDQHETLVLECTNVHQFGGCDPPGRLPGFSPA